MSGVPNLVRHRRQELVLELGRVLGHRPRPFGDENLIAQFALAHHPFADVLDDGDGSDDLSRQRQRRYPRALDCFAAAAAVHGLRDRNEELVETVREDAHLAFERAAIVLVQTARGDGWNKDDERPPDRVFRRNPRLRARARSSTRER